MRKENWLIAILLILATVLPGKILAQLGSDKITVSYPNGGECLIPGSQVTVTWTKEGSVDHVAIGYRTDNNQPSSWDKDYQAWDDHPVYGTSFKWTVPNVTSTTVKLWIEGHPGGEGAASHARVAIDSSNNAFAISNTCGIDQPPSASGPQITQVLIGDKSFVPTETIQIEKGQDVTLVGQANSNETVTIYVKTNEKRFSAQADGDGKWTFDIWTKNLETGQHQVDLETPTSPRTKALVFVILEVGQAPTTPLPSPQSKLPTEQTPAQSGSVERTTGPFPLVALGAGIGVTVLVGIVTFLMVRRQRKRLDETPTVQPPELT
jgi:hypothetical protein